MIYLHKVHTSELYTSCTYALKIYQTGEDALSYRVSPNSSAFSSLSQTNLSRTPLQLSRSITRIDRTMI